MAETTRTRELIGRDVASIAASAGAARSRWCATSRSSDDLGTRFLVTLSNYEDGPVVELMTQPGAVFGQSDAGAHVAQLCDANMPTELLAHWVRDRGAMTVEHAVHKLTAELADLFGASNRGRLVPGAAADVVVFDLDTLDPGPLRRVRDLPGDEERLIADEPTRDRARAASTALPITAPRRIAGAHHDRTPRTAGAGRRERRSCAGRPATCGSRRSTTRRPRVGEVKVAVAAVGVCHTDLNFTSGQVPVPYPIVLGHEARRRGRRVRRRASRPSAWATT